jgi:lipopolysaccharide heptosyltransferase I
MCLNVMIEFATDPDRILLIKPSAIGDVVHALPILNLLRKRWPGSHISWLVTPGCAGLLDGHPQLDEVILFERHRYAKLWRDPELVMELLALTRELRRRRFDLAIDLQGLFRSGWLTYQSRAPIRIGFSNSREFAWLGYTHQVSVDTIDTHAVERYLAVTDLLGCGREVEFVFATTDADREVANYLTRGIDRYALLFPGTNWPTKRWPVAHFAAMVEPLQKRFGLRSIVGGSSGEAQLASQIRGAVNLAGKTNLRQLTALIERADLVISNDSGPMHIAAALGKPLVALFGPTNPTRTGPYQREDSVVRLDIPCSPCYARRCVHQSCLRWLSVDAVMRVVEASLKREVSGFTPETQEPASSPPAAHELPIR